MVFGERRLWPLEPQKRRGTAAGATPPRSPAPPGSRDRDGAGTGLRVPVLSRCGADLSPGSFGGFGVSGFGTRGTEPPEGSGVRGSVPDPRDGAGGAPGVPRPRQLRDGRAPGRERGGRAGLGRSAAGRRLRGLNGAETPRGHRVRGLLVLGGLLGVGEEGGAVVPFFGVGGDALGTAAAPGASRSGRSSGAAVRGCLWGPRCPGTAPLGPQKGSGGGPEPPPRSAGRCCCPPPPLPPALPFSPAFRGGFGGRARLGRRPAPLSRSFGARPAHACASDTAAHTRVPPGPPPCTRVCPRTPPCTRTPRARAHARVRAPLVPPFRLRSWVGATALDFGRWSGR